MPIFIFGLIEQITLVSSSFFLMLACPKKAWHYPSPPLTLGSDRPLQLVWVKITKRCRNRLEVAGQASQTHYHSISGENLPHFYVKNTFLAQKLTKLEHFKEILENVIETSFKIQKNKSTTIY